MIFDWIAERLLAWYETLGLWLRWKLSICQGSILDPYPSACLSCIKHAATDRDHSHSNAAREKKSGTTSGGDTRHSALSPVHNPCTHPSCPYSMRPLPAPKPINTRHSFEPFHAQLGLLSRKAAVLTATKGYLSPPRPTTWACLPQFGRLSALLRNRLPGFSLLWDRGPFAKESQPDDMLNEKFEQTAIRFSAGTLISSLRCQCLPLALGCLI